MDFQTFDTAYVDRLRRGEAATEQHFVSYFSELITLKLRSRLQSPHAIQDVRQETFVRVIALLRSEGGIRHGERLGPLVNSICNNVLFEHYRASTRADPLEDEKAATLLDEHTDSLHEVISAETRATVHRVLEGLGERDRRVLRALFVEERDRDEICREMRVDRQYMRVLVHRAKQAFRTEFEKGSNPRRSQA